MNEQNIDQQLDIGGISDPKITLVTSNYQRHRVLTNRSMSSLNLRTWNRSRSNNQRRYQENNEHPVTQRQRLLIAPPETITQYPNFQKNINMKQFQLLPTKNVYQDSYHKKHDFQYQPRNYEKSMNYQMAAELHEQEKGYLDVFKKLKNGANISGQRMQYYERKFNGAKNVSPKNKLLREERVYDQKQHDYVAQKYQDHTQKNYSPRNKSTTKVVQYSNKPIHEQEYIPINQNIARPGQYQRRYKD